jgi:hypothetical protein
VLHKAAAAAHRRVPCVRQGILALIPGARLALLDCGDEAPIERPQETAGLIEAFVAGLGG